MVSIYVNYKSIGMKTYLFSFALLLGSLAISAQITVKARVYLEGALMNNGNALSSSGKPLMRDNLRLSPFTNTSYIPLNDPYKYGHPNFDITSRYTHVPANQAASQHQINATVLDVTGDDAIVDWVFMELRSPIDSSGIVATRSCLVQRDGDVVDMDGVSPVLFPTVNGNFFYVALRHRNHLGAMTKIRDVSQVVDFTSPNTPMYDFGQVSASLNYTGKSQNYTVINGYGALFAGDFNADGAIKVMGANDDLSSLMFDVIFHSSNATYRGSFDSAIGYFNSDFNLNSKSKFDNPFDDTNLLYSQIFFYPNNNQLLINFASLVEQLPK